MFHNQQPYNRTGRTELFNRRILVLLPIFLAAHTFHSFWNAPRAFCSLFLISLLPPPSLSTIAPRQSNSSTSSTSSKFHHDVLPVPCKLSPRCLAISRIKFIVYSGCFLRQSPSFLTQVIKLG